MWTQNFLTKTLENLISQYLFLKKKERRQVEFIPGMQGCFITQKYITKNK